MTVRVQLRVSPGGRRTEVVARYGDAWRVRVAAPPARGRANDALLRHMAELLDIPPADVRVAAGAGSRNKVVEVSGRSLEEVEAALARAIDA